MKLSTKGKYGLRAIIDLARFSEKEPVSIGCIATRQKLSERYLEQLFALLKKAWQKINDSINKTVNEIKLDELVKESKELNPEGVIHGECSQQ